jgi:hypothetical protein
VARAFLSASNFTSPALMRQNRCAALLRKGNWSERLAQDRNHRQKGRQSGRA